MKDLKYWKGRCVDSRQMWTQAKKDKSRHEQEFKRAYTFAQRRVEQLERQILERKVT